MIGCAVWRIVGAPWRWYNALRPLPWHGSMSTTSQSDSLLTQRIRAGGAEAWNELIERFEGRLLAFVEARTGRRGAAEDVVQETFIGFLTSLPNYDPRRSLESYLFSIAAHKLTDYLRREGRRPSLPLSPSGRSSSPWEPAGSARPASAIAPQRRAAAARRAGPGRRLGRTDRTLPAAGRMGKTLRPRACCWSVDWATRRWPSGWGSPSRRWRMTSSSSSPGCGRRSASKGCRTRSFRSCTNRRKNDFRSASGF